MYHARFLLPTRNSSGRAGSEGALAPEPPRAPWSGPEQGGILQRGEYHGSRPPKEGSVIFPRVTIRITLVRSSGRAAAPGLTPLRLPRVPMRSVSSWSWIGGRSCDECVSWTLAASPFLFLQTANMIPKLNL